MKKEVEKIELPSEVKEAYRNLIIAENRMIEKACEQALQSGTCGVMVIKDRYHRVVSANPNPTVPYGHVYVVTNDIQYGDVGE